MENIFLFLGHLEVSNEKTNAKCEKLSGKVNDPSNKKSFGEKFVVSQWRKRGQKREKLSLDRKSTRLNSSHALTSRMPSSA